MSDVHEPDPDQGRGGTGYETSDAPLGPVLGFLVVLAGALALTMLVAAWVVGAFEKRTLEGNAPPHPMRDFRTEAAGPRLQARPDLELEEHRQVEELKATTYAWIDPTSGVVRIPLERARELILRDGLPEVSGDPTPPEDKSTETGSSLEVETSDGEEGQ